MNREDIIRMAREAGLTGLKEADVLGNFERFAALVAAAEREACAKVCEEVGNRDAITNAWDAAAAIRSRGEVKP